MGSRLGRFFFGVLAGALLLLGQAAGAAESALPIVFVHGNGDRKSVV